MQEEKFSPQESLQLIESMIDQAKSRFSENGHLYLLWGWIVIASFPEYDYQILMVPIAMIIAWIIPGYFLRAKYKLQTP
jgi:hypothetical protein